MKKLDKLVLGGLMLTAAQVYANPPRPDEMVRIVQKVTDNKIKLFEEKIQRLVPSERRALVNHMIGYIVLADIAYASNANDVICMPYIQHICPKNPGRELQESGIRIGPISSDELARIVAPPLDFRHLSEGKLLPEGLSHSYQGPEVWFREDYRTLLQEIGPLIPIYLDALYNPRSVILPKKVARPIAYPEDVPLFEDDEETIPNKAFFKQWYENICSRYFIDDASATTTSFLYFCCFGYVGDRKEKLSQELQDFSNYLERQNLDKSAYFTSLKGGLKENFPSQQETIEAAFQGHRVE